jgi:hypothetical protein
MQVLMNEGASALDISLAPGNTRRKGGIAMVYLQASIKLRAGKLQDFVSLLNSLTPVVGKHGWKLLGSYASIVGRLNTVVDLWELPNEAALQAALSDSEMAKFASRNGEIVEDETLTLLNKLPIS